MQVPFGIWHTASGARQNKCTAWKLSKSCETHTVSSAKNVLLRRRARTGFEKDLLQLVALRVVVRYLVDPASSHMLVSKIKPCMSKYKLLYGETADGSLKQLLFP